MRTEKFDGTISSAFGRPVSPTLKFAGKYEAFGPDKNVKTYLTADWDEALEEIKSANKFPSNEEIVNFVNNRELANARQKQMSITLSEAGIEKPTQEDPQFRFETMVKLIMLNDKKVSEAEARQTASMVLNFTPATV